MNRKPWNLACSRPGSGTRCTGWHYTSSAAGRASLSSKICTGSTT